MNIRRAIAAPLVILALGACGDDARRADTSAIDTSVSDAASDTDDTSGLATFAPEVVDWSALPLARTVDGDRVIYAIEGVSLAVNPERVDPIVVQGRCGVWLGKCVADGGHPLDACVADVPRCPDVVGPDVLCCPAACVEAYDARRAAGSTPAIALREVLFIDGTCVPGLAALRSE